MHTSVSSYALRALIVALLLVVPCRAMAKGSGDYAPIAEAGATIYTGTTGKSITGSYGFGLTFRAEVRKGFFRWSMGTELATATGKTTIGSDTPSFTLYGATFVPGVHLFPFQESRIAPFFGGNGVLAWHMLKIASPPTGTEPQTQGVSYGFEVNAGVDIRTGSLDGTAFRLRSSYSSISTSLAGISGFQLTGFRLSIGIVW